MRFKVARLDCALRTFDVPPGHAQVNAPRLLVFGQISYQFLLCIRWNIPKRTVATRVSLGTGYFSILRSFPTVEFNEERKNPSTQIESSKDKILRNVVQKFSRKSMSSPLPNLREW